MKDFLIHSTIALAITAMLMIAAYNGITTDLCRRIDTFTPQEQASMKLSAAKCAKPWYAKL